MVDIIVALKYLATFASGSYEATENRAFNKIATDLGAILHELTSPEFIEHEKLMESDIYELNMTCRTTNCLKAAGIKLVSDLINCTERDLRIMPNLGRKSLAEIKGILGAKRLKLKGRK
jgi:DNA-directed RNA polymerase alpha subunit